MVYADVDANEQLTNPDVKLVGVDLFMDVNQNRARDPEEAFARTDAQGRYQFSGLTKGTYNLLAERQAGYSLPVSHTITLDSFTSTTRDLPLQPEPLGRFVVPSRSIQEALQYPPNFGQCTWIATIIMCTTLAKYVC